MSQPGPAREPRRVGTATHRLMESYKDDYPSHAKGIFQEAIQNSVDARLSPQGFKDLTIVIEYDRDQRTLRIRDYGTTGMSHCTKCDWGIKVETNEDCHEKECKWGNFHYIGGLSKEARQLGSRGQGKSLAIVAGKRLVVRTKLVGQEHVSMGSEWTRKGDEWYWQNFPDLQLGPSDPPGTELIIYDVDDDVHDQLLDTDPLVGDISQMWFKVLQRGTTIRLGYDGQKLTKIGPPRFPEPGLSEAGQKVVRQRARIPVPQSHKVVGELEDVAMCLADEPVREELRGIALVKNGTQVIERLVGWGRKIPLELQDRLYGWATYYCSDERPFLLKCERPGHRGFTPHPFYTKVKDLLQQQVDDFLNPFAKQQLRPRLTEKDRKRAQQNLHILKKAFEENPDFNPWSGEGIIVRERQRRPQPENPYISEIHPDKEWYKRGDVANVTVVILNPTKEFQPFVHLTVEGLDQGLSPLVIRELPPVDLPTLPPASEEMKGRIAPSISIPITADFAPGRNWVRCTLSHRPPPTSDPVAQESSAERQWDRGSHALWVEREPEKRTHAPPKGGSGGDGGRPGTLMNLVPITEAPLDPVENEVMPYWSDGEIWFFTRGARIGSVYDRQPRTADSILYELISETVAERIMQIRIDADARDRFDKSQVLEEFRRTEEQRRRFLRSCERFRSVSEESG